MSTAFSFTMPGQPPTWNHMYRWTTKNVGGRQIRIQVKTDEASLYQTQLTLVARSAKPSTFKPQGQVLVAYDLCLGRDLDADNVMKAINDALAIALEVNDKQFLPCVIGKTHGSKQPWVEIHVYDASAYRTIVKQKEEAWIE